MRCREIFAAVAVVKINVTDISPLPKPKPRDIKSGRKQQTSEEITASPYKRGLEIKEQGKQSTKSGTSCKRGLQFQESKSSKEKTQGGRKNKQNTNDEETFCIYCSEQYGLTQEEWIMCKECKKWAHEQCTDVENLFEQFICDMCRS
ncbi:hypothetical protein C0J52_22383 [Blattella germanica]|nr:hypothetical protein C0J52_22383 [Blattella germanica]